MKIDRTKLKQAFIPSGMNITKLAELFKKTRECVSAKVNGRKSFTEEETCFLISTYGVEILG